MLRQIQLPTLPPPPSSNEGLAVTERPVTVTGITVKTKFEQTHSQRELGSDAFSYYSNKFNRMKTLLMKEDDVQVLQSAGITFQGPATKRRKGSNAQPVQIQDAGVRQTRLAFEVHPSLLIYDDIIRMFEQMDCAKISDKKMKEEKRSQMMFWMISFWGMEKIWVTPFQMMTKKMERRLRLLVEEMKLNNAACIEGLLIVRHFCSTASYLYLLSRESQTV
jgi:hypothetical protein